MAQSIMMQRPACATLQLKLARSVVSAEVAVDTGDMHAAVAQAWLDSARCCILHIGDRSPACSCLARALTRSLAQRRTSTGRGSGAPDFCIGRRNAQMVPSSGMIWTSRTNSPVAWYGSAHTMRSGTLCSLTLPWTPLHQSEGFGQAKCVSCTAQHPRRRVGDAT